MNRRFSGLQRLLSCSFLILCFALIANAQFKAALQGTVSDSSGASVVGATIVLTNVETNQEVQTLSNDDGFYRFNGLAPGNYKLTVTQTNFKQSVTEEVKIDAEDLKGLDVKLEAGGISEIVTVEADNAPLQTEDANIRKVITNEEVLQLPQIGRDPYELARLAPGAYAPR